MNGLRRFAPMVIESSQADTSSAMCLDDPQGDFIRYDDVVPLLLLLQEIRRGWEGPPTGVVNDARYQRTPIRIEQITKALAKAGI